MNIKKFLICALTMLVLVGCKTKGTLNVVKDFAIKSTDGRSVKLTQGKYDTKIKIKNDQIELDIKDVDKVVMKLPKGNFDQAEYHIRASDLDQDFHISVANFDAEDYDSGASGVRIIIRDKVSGKEIASFKSK